MANLRLLWNNLLTAPATIVSSSSAIAALPAANATIPDRSLIWRSSTTTGDQSVTFDLGSAMAVTGVALANPKVHSGGAIKVQRSPDGSAWTDVATFPTADIDTKVTYVFCASLSYRYWRILFVNTGAASDYVEVGYVFAGTYFEPVNNVIGPLAAPLVDPSVLVKSIGGQRTVTVRPQQSTGTFAWQSLPESDRATLQTIFRTQGQGLPTFAVLQTTLSWTAWLLYFGASAGGSAVLSRTFTVVDTYFDLSLDWEEAL